MYTRTITENNFIYSDSLVKGEDLDKFIETLYESPTIALIFDVALAYGRKTQDFFVKIYWRRFYSYRPARRLSPI